MLSAVSTSSTDVVMSRGSSTLEASAGATTSTAASAACADGSPSVEGRVPADGERVNDTIVTLANAAPASSVMPMAIGRHARRGCATGGTRAASNARSSNVAGIGGTRRAKQLRVRVPSRVAVFAGRQMLVDGRAFGCREARAAIRIEDGGHVVAVHAISPMRAAAHCRSPRVTCRGERALGRAAL